MLVQFSALPPRSMRCFFVKTTLFAGAVFAPRRVPASNMPFCQILLQNFANASMQTGIDFSQSFGHVFVDGRFTDPQDRRAFAHGRARLYNVFGAQHCPPFHILPHAVTFPLFSAMLHFMSNGGGLCLSPRRSAPGAAAKTRKKQAGNCRFPPLERNEFYRSANLTGTNLRFICCDYPKRSCLGWPR